MHVYTVVLQYMQLSLKWKFFYFSLFRDVQCILPSERFLISWCLSYIIHSLDVIQIPILLNTVKRNHLETFVENFPLISFEKYELGECSISDLRE